MKNLIWYASYGSNLLASRFLCYIRGGVSEGAKKSYIGCSDKSKPLEDKPVFIPNELYFSKQSSIWENKGVAFIKPEKNEQIKTLGRMYLISEPQFVEVVRQENDLEPNDKTITIDFDTTIANGRSQISANWYSNIIYLGKEQGQPIFTFTSNWFGKKISYRAPGEKYLKTIIKGIKETYHLDDVVIVGYLKNLDGIKNQIDEQTIMSMVTSS